RRVDGMKIEARLARLEDRMNLAERRCPRRAREGAARARHFHRGRPRTAVERGGLIQSNVDHLERRGDAEEHRGHLFGGHFDQVVATKTEESDDLFGNLVVVARERDATRSSGGRQIHPEGEIDVYSLLALALERPYTDDAVDFEAADPDEIHRYF